MEDGTIKGNRANSFGGGVYVHETPNNIFIKKGGTIYGDTDNTHTPGTNENTAKSSGQGHAVYSAAPTPRYRNTDAGPDVKLYAASDGDGAWTYNGGGVGDTSANWQ
jgi:hypothetical protein